MGTRRRILLLVAIALGLFGLVYAFVEYDGPTILVHAITNPQKDNLSFHFERCDNDAYSINDNPPQASWDNSQTIRVAAIAEVNCGTNWMFGDYSVRGNTLALEYQAIVQVPFLCDCARKVTYRIEGIPKKDYRVEIAALPEIQTGWMTFSLWFAMALVAVGLAAAYGVSILVVRRWERGSPSAAPHEVRTIRRAGVTLLVMLFLAGVLNVVLWYIAGSAFFYAVSDASMNESVISSLGSSEGRDRADRDFAAGTPRWFQTDDAEGVPVDRPGRTITTMDAWRVLPRQTYRKAYVNSYNWRMDKHMPPPRGAGKSGAAKKG